MEERDSAVEQRAGNIAGGEMSRSSQQLIHSQVEKQAGHSYKRYFWNVFNVVRKNCFGDLARHFLIVLYAKHED